MNDACPICVDPSRCKGYAHLWKRMREDPARWKPIHDDVNGIVPTRNEIVDALIAQMRPVAQSVGKAVVPTGKCCG